MANYHVIVVHFPVALLSVYAILEMLRFKKMQNLPYWFYVKAVFVILGSFFSILALITGNMIQAQFQSDPELYQVIEVHAGFAGATVFLFGSLALLYMRVWAHKAGFNLEIPRWMAPWKREAENVVSDGAENPKKGFPIRRLNFYLFAKWFLNSALIVIFALMGLILIIITGALGGAVAYGPNIDPLVSLVHGIFIK